MILPILLGVAAGLVVSDTSKKKALPQGPEDLDVPMPAQEMQKRLYDAKMETPSTMMEKPPIVKTTLPISKKAPSSPPMERIAEPVKSGPSLIRQTTDAPLFARPFEKKPIDVSDLHLKEKDVIHKGVLLKRVPNEFGDMDDLGDFRFFKSPMAHEFGQKMLALGFEGIPHSQKSKDLWNKFFVWLKAQEMPSVKTSLINIPHPLEHQALIENAEKRGLFTDESFESLKRFLNEYKGSPNSAMLSMKDVLGVNRI